MRTAPDTAAQFVEHLSARDDVNLRTAVAFLLRQEREATRQALLAEANRRDLLAVAAFLRRATIPE